MLVGNGLSSDPWRMPCIGSLKELNVLYIFSVCRATRNVTEKHIKTADANVIHMFF